MSHALGFSGGEHNHLLAFGIFKIQIKISRRSPVSGYWLSRKYLQRKLKCGQHWLLLFPVVKLSFSNSKALWTSKSLIYSVSAGLKIRYGRLGSVNNRYLFSRSPRGWKSEIKTSVWFLSPWLQTSTFFLHPHRVFSLGAHTQLD